MCSATRWCPRRRRGGPIRATSSDRVAWTETRNLAVEDPQVAWRIMAATAMDQQRLKAQAGIDNTGRKSIDSVLHLTLSWHPEESAGLSREEMLRAANGALRALKAEDRQALIVCHDDEPQPHVHVLLNRVSPDDGRMLPSSKEKLVLSQWAEGYEQERGQVLCQERVTNNAARKRGEYSRGEADTPRHILELEQANAHKRGIEKMQAEQRANDRALAKTRRERAERRAWSWEELVQRQNKRIGDIRQQHKREAQRTMQEVQARFRPQWAALHRAHEDQVRAFNANEERFMGRMRNTLSAIDFRAIAQADSRCQALGEAFDAIASKGARLEALRRVQEKAERALLARQRGEAERQIEQLRERRDEKLVQQRMAFMAERASLVLVHDMEDAALRHEWGRRSEQRRLAYERHRSTGDDDKRTLEDKEMSERLKRAHESASRNRQDRDQHRPRRGW